MSAFYIFCICVLAGIAGGAEYGLLSLLRAPRPLRAMRWVRYALDLLFCLAFAAGFLALGVAMGFLPFRLYMAGGILAGFALYRKSLHKIVAFFAKKLYNTIKKQEKEPKICPEGKRALPKKR